jgi:hypothetical protein
MPVISMINNSGDKFPEGSYCPIGKGSWNDFKSNPDCAGSICLNESYHGLCLFESEANGYHDSDFYMTVWDPESEKAFKVLFATTRGWSYPCYGSRPDATPDVIEAYEAWKKANDRRRRILYRWKLREADIKTAATCRITRKDLRKLRATVGDDALPAFIALLKVKNYRSKFRKSVAGQVRAWLDNENPNYNRPLSYKQMKAIGAIY